MIKMWPVTVGQFSLAYVTEKWFQTYWNPSYDILWFLWGIHRLYKTVSEKIGHILNHYDHLGYISNQIRSQFSSWCVIIQKLQFQVHNEIEIK